MLSRNRGKLLGTEVTQQDLADANYPRLEFEEAIIDDLPAFYDLKRANEPVEEGQDPYVPILERDRKELAKFICNTLKGRGRKQLWEFATVKEDLIKWKRLATPKKFFSQSFENMGEALAELIWESSEAVGIRVSLEHGIELGTYSDNPEEMVYEPYLRILYRSNQ